MRIYAVVCTAQKFLNMTKVIVQVVNRVYH
jgi:hypothetical protein